MEAVPGRCESHAAQLWGRHHQTREAFRDHHREASRTGGSWEHAPEGDGARAVPVGLQVEGKGSRVRGKAPFTGRHTTTLRRLASRSGRLPAALWSNTHLLHAAGGRRALASSLGGQLLAGRLAAGALAARGRHGRVSTRALCAQLPGARSRTGPSASYAPWLRRRGDECGDTSAACAQTAGGLPTHETGRAGGWERRVLECALHLAHPLAMNRRCLSGLLPRFTSRWEA